MRFTLTHSMQMPFSETNELSQLWGESRVYVFVSHLVASGVGVCSGQV